MVCIIDIIVPLCMTNCDKSELRLYDNLPCQYISAFKSLNFYIEKSLARAA